MKKGSIVKFFVAFMLSLFGVIFGVLFAATIYGREIGQEQAKKGSSPHDLSKWKFWVWPKSQQIDWYASVAGAFVGSLIFLGVLGVIF